MASVTETTLRRILANAKIRPFKVSYYCERLDPDFESKMHDGIVIYKQVSLQFDEAGNLRPFEGMSVHTLSYDEKPGMQALDTTADDRPPVAGTEKTVQYSGTMNMCGWARLQPSTCLPAAPL